jgi:sulfur-oxidizing protein SoxZ
MAMSKPRIKFPDAIKVGDVIDVKTVITHMMETGNRRDADGLTIPRDIINSFVAKFDGVEVFRATFGSGISANPYLSFPLRVTGPGQLECTWTDDEGKSLTETATLTPA